jgi:hypothetical protein
LFGNCEARLTPLDWPWLTFLENPDHRPSKNKPFSQEMHLKTLLLSQVWNCQIVNQVVEYQLFTISWHKYHQWLSNMELS